MSKVRAFVLTLPILMGTVGVSAAQVRPNASVSGLGIVEGKDPSKRTVTIEGTVYRVEDRTRLLGKRGEEIRFEEIPVLVEGRRSDRVAGSAAAAVGFEASGTERGLVLESLRVVGHLPQ